MAVRSMNPRASHAPLALYAVLASIATLTFFYAFAGGADPRKHISEEQYYSMPELFRLDEYDSCLARGHVYCLGTLQLRPAEPDSPLFALMQSISAEWATHYNHTELHRGVCLGDCPAAETAPPALGPAARFEACVDRALRASHGLRARLRRLQHCERGPLAPPPPGREQRAFAALLAAAALSSGLDLLLSARAKKGLQWALCWSVPGNWRRLRGPGRAPADSALGALDGLRVLCLLCVVLQHVCWLGTRAYSADPRYSETTRRDPDVLLMSNSTLVVQLFLVMSSFLLADKLLRRVRRGLPTAPLRTFARALLQRFVRLSPSYFAVVWYARTWMERGGSGPLWAPLVLREAQVCRRKWWTHLLYLNNVLYPADKCLIHTWYLAADMQLYALGLALTLALSGGCAKDARRALLLLLALFALSVGALLALARAWDLVPTFLLHSFESVRAEYRDGWSFDALYQSPLGNAPGALAGLLLAFANHHLLLTRPDVHSEPWFRWATTALGPLAVAWVAFSPHLTGEGGAPGPWALAGSERAVFALLAAGALLGALRGPSSPGAAWAPLARLSFGALLLHMPINKALVAGARHPRLLNRQTTMFETIGVAGVSFAGAVPLALLVELPAQRLYSLLTEPSPSPAEAKAPSPDCVAPLLITPAALNRHQTYPKPRLSPRASSLKNT